MTSNFMLDTHCAITNLFVVEGKGGGRRGGRRRRRRRLSLLFATISVFYTHTFCTWHIRTFFDHSQFSQRKDGGTPEREIQLRITYVAQLFIFYTFLVVLHFAFFFQTHIPWKVIIKVEFYVVYYLVIHKYIHYMYAYVHIHSYLYNFFKKMSKLIFQRLLFYS